MALVKCKACGGEYNTVQERDTKYYHACPPIELVKVERLGATIEVERKDVAVGDREISSKLVARAGARDENVKITGYDKTGTAITAAKDDGAGTQPATK